MSSKIAYNTRKQENDVNNLCTVWKNAQNTHTKKEQLRTRGPPRPLMPKLPPMRCDVFSGSVQVLWSKPFCIPCCVARHCRVNRGLRTNNTTNPYFHAFSTFCCIFDISVQPRHEWCLTAPLSRRCCITPTINTRTAEPFTATDTVDVRFFALLWRKGKTLCNRRPRQGVDLRAVAPLL